MSSIGLDDKGSWKKKNIILVIIPPRVPDLTSICFDV